MVVHTLHIHGILRLRDSFQGPRQVFEKLQEYAQILAKEAIINRTFVCVLAFVLLHQPFYEEFECDAPQ